MLHLLHCTGYAAEGSPVQVAHAPAALEARGESRACAEPGRKNPSAGVTGRLRALGRRRGGRGREARAQSVRRGRGSSAGRPRAPPGARPGERKAREGRAGEGSGAREGLSARRFWLKYSKWRTEEQRVKMRVQPRRQQQQVIITAFYIFIFILEPGSRAPPRLSIIY